MEHRSKKGEVAEGSVGIGEISLLESKKQSYYLRIKSIYESIPTSQEDRQTPLFISQATNIDSMREEFQNIVDNINRLNLKLDPKYLPNYEAIWAFEDYYCGVKNALTRFNISQNVNTAEHNEQYLNFQLEKLSIPEFYGDYEKFPMFIECYNSMVHNNPSLNDSLRVRYLISKLKGKAESIWLSLSPTAENYNIIYNALVDKYTDDREIATTYIEKILNLKSLHNATPSQLDAFIDEYSTSVAALKQLKIDNLLDYMFVHLGLRKLDTDTVQQFENINRKQSYPNYEEFVIFLREQYKILKRITPDIKINASAGSKYKHCAAGDARSGRSTQRAPRALIANDVTARLNKHCSFCKSNEHEQIYNCAKFKTLSPLDRYKYIKNVNGCINCLSLLHTSRFCQSVSSCKFCKGNKRHHSLLHFPENSLDGMVGGNSRSLTSDNQLHNNDTSKSTQDKTVSLCSQMNSESTRHKNKIILLGSAVILVKDKNSILHPVRVLIDMGSQRHFITKQCCKKLGLNIFNSANSIQVNGIGDNPQPIQGIANVTVFSRHNDFRLNIQCLVINKISGDLPQVNVDCTSLDYLFNLPLADQSFHTKGPIDMLIGSEVFAHILKGNKIIGSNGNPDALESEFGYIIVGSARVLQSASANATACLSDTYSYICSEDTSMEGLMNRFLNVEDVPDKKHFSPADKQCELLYSNNISRDKSGRFTTILPFNQDPSQLGDSFKIASKRYTHLERKFKLNNNLKLQYDEIIREYLNKNYITRIDNYNSSERQYIIPHHAVSRNDKISTKLRIVLDASAKTTSGLSLNDCLHTGPNLQNDLLAILIQFRLFPIAISADIKQMYLQILVHNNYRKFLRILYRFEDEDSANLYEFNRVCFGLSCSPYLAMRTIRELAEQERQEYPYAADVAQSNLFMDDLAISVCTPQEGINLSNQLINMFKKGGFDLVKFISNCPALLESIPENHNLSHVHFDQNDNLKLLGLKWIPEKDQFVISVKETSQIITKRIILATIARLWDINGFCAPVILKAKLIMKSLWLQHVDWDECPPQDICDAWCILRNELPLLSSVKIPRFLGVPSYSSELIVVGFSDASESGYGANVYLCIKGSPNTVNLVCAKSKVSPTANKMQTLARLELCALLLLSKLIHFVITTISPRCNITNIFALTDSTVALYWAHSSPHRFQVYVANRIARIQEYLSPKHIFHVAGKDNPSDCLSRGLLPSQLLDHPTWMHGPTWLQNPVTEWPIRRFLFEDQIFPPDKQYEHKNDRALVTTINEQPFFHTVAARLSSWSKLLRVATYVLIFIRKIPRSNTVTVNQLKIAELYILRSVQQVHFATELTSLKENRALTKSFRTLSPFIDSDGLIRVGGRLQHSSLRFEAKHPILLPKRDHITNILIDYYHKKYLHAGPHQLLSMLRLNYWIISGRTVVRKRFQACNSCFKVSPKPMFPYMSALPSFRVNEAKPFLKTGTDYAGPIPILISRYRGARQEKAYICLFTCLVTRAVHIEFAVDLSTESFIKAFKRFISRRGNCLELFSDNGTNFVGAKAHYNDLHNFIKSKTYSEAFLNEAVEHGITWKTITPNAPHFGGAWESNIKSIKSHLKRVIGDTLLTYEEFTTLLTQIECILNSRPLSVLSSDPAEPTALTPAHFLNYEPLNSFNLVDTASQPQSLLKRKYLLDKLVESYWKRWRNEYLSTLQTRQKWNARTANPTVGSVVLLKSDNAPPLRWPLGIIETCHPGADGIVRVVTVRTQSGTYTRPVVKVCPLPTQ